VNSAFVSKLVNDLTDLGLDVLLDKKHLRGGHSTEAEIRAKIAQSDYFVPVMTSQSVRSKWVRPVEVAYALRLQKEGRRLRILPLLLKESRLKFDELEGLTYVDFTGSYAIALAKLVQALPKPEYDEIANLRKEIDEEKIQERSLLSILRRVATRPRKSNKMPNWPDLSAKQLMKEIGRVIKSREFIDDAYWWLIVYGVLRFKNVEKFWDEESYDGSVKYARVAARGVALMIDLSSEHVGGRSSPLLIRRSSSGKPIPRSRRSRR
jgi:hypothetical protein